MKSPASNQGNERVFDRQPAERQLLREIQIGMDRAQRRLPTPLFYDQRGAELFEKITQTDEYYVTRTEWAILRSSIQEMVDCAGPEPVLIEYGSGAGKKTRFVLEHLESPFGYIPIDISNEQLVETAQALAVAFPALRVQGICADFREQIDISNEIVGGHRKVLFFPGSSVGNFTPGEAREFLGRAARTVGKGGGLWIGVDTTTSSAVIEAAYDDAGGVTAEFNLNVLAHINRRFGGDFDLSQYEHRAPYNSECGRIEMRLRAMSSQFVTIGDQRWSIKAGEEIVTEYSYKYSSDKFVALAEGAGFRCAQEWRDAGSMFSVLFFEAT